MHCLLSVVLLLLVLPPLNANAAEPQKISATARISTVTLYQDRAMVGRSATVTLPRGSSVVIFADLPPLIQDDSVRIEGKGTAAATIAGIEVKRVFLEQTGEKKIKELEDELRGLERRSGTLDAKKIGLVSQKSFLDSIRVAWGDRISKELAIGRPTSAELLDASSFVAAGVTKIEEQFRDIDFEKRQISDKMDVLKRQRDESAGTRKKETKTVEVAIETSREGTLTLDLTTVMPQAGWEPSYDVRLAGNGKNAELTFRAMAHQKTGEDWNGVSLTLSTARPATGGSPPELYPWRVSLFRPMPAPMAMLPPPPAASPMKAKKAVRAQKSEAFADEAPMLEAVADYMVAQVSGEQTSVSFRIPRSVDIPSDGTRHGTVVATEQLPVKLEFLAVPKLSPHVFLKSEIVNQAAYPLLPGRANVFTGNTFIGTSALKKVAAGEKFDLFFGTDDQMIVKREEVKQHKEAGVFGSNRMNYRYRIEIQNFRKDEQIVTLKDQLPLSGDNEIKVSLEDPTLKPDEMKNDGQMIWKLPIKSGEKRELNFSIQVEYPKEREITGL